MPTSVRGICREDLAGVYQKGGECNDDWDHSWGGSQGEYGENGRKAGIGDMGVVTEEHPLRAPHYCFKLWYAPSWESLTDLEQLHGPGF